MVRPEAVSQQSGDQQQAQQHHEEGLGRALSLGRQDAVPGTCVERHAPMNTHNARMTVYH